MGRGTLITVIAIAAAAMLHPASAAATYPGPNGPIYFSRVVGTMPALPDIFSVTPGGTPVNLTNTPASSERDPAVSADGTRVTYVRDNEVWAMNADGSGQVSLTFNPGVDRDPYFSPDGSKIVWSREVDAGTMPDEIFIMNADGSNQTNLTDNGLNDFDADPSFSPDGSKIAFVRSSANNEIWTMNADGSGQTSLTDEAQAADADPNWSPDGARIAFARDQFLLNREDIWVMDADGSNEVNLTNTPSEDNDGSPSYSPDGTRIAFTRLAAPSLPNVFTMAAGGAEQANLTNGTTVEASVAWGRVPVDSDPPETEITKGVKNKISKPKAKLKFSSDEPGSSFECKLDKKGYKPCTSPKTLKNLDDGKHKFLVHAIDPSGNVDPTAAKEKFRVKT